LPLVATQAGSGTYRRSFSPLSPFRRYT
jgi:hypothetical protein